MSSKIDEIIEKLKQISLLEASELVKRIEETFGVDATTKLQTAAVEKAGLIPQEAPVIEEKTEFDVVMESVQAAKRLTAIKVIRSITSLGLKEAKDIIEGLPKVVLQGVSKDKAEETKKMLEEAGASITLK